MTLRVSISDNKYIVVQDQNGSRALRHGEPWRDLTGDNLVLGLAYELDEARQQNEALRVQVGILVNRLELEKFQYREIRTHTQDGELACVCATHETGIKALLEQMPQGPTSENKP